MDSEFDPFIAGLPFGIVIGLGPLLTPKLCVGLLVLVLLWMAFVFLYDGLPGFEALALKHLQQIAKHGRVVAGLWAGALLSFTVVRWLLKTTDD